MKREQVVTALRGATCMVHSYLRRRRVRGPIIMRSVLLFLAITFCGCSHLRPPDDYSWNDKRGDPGGLDRASATQWDLQKLLSDNASRKFERDFMQNVQRLQRPLQPIPTAPPVQVTQ